MYKSANPAYTHEFMKHFQSFIEEYALFNSSEPLAVAVSGGIDSIAVLYCLQMLESFGYSNRLLVIHINHGTRAEQLKEQLFVETFCKELGVDFKTTKLDSLDVNKNFEKNAREKRYEAFSKLTDGKCKVILAHHIDDSFEWSTLQTLRSSNIEGLIGIPLKNGKVIRPFMCVTKAQVTRFVQYLDLPFIEDPTNMSLRHERNFIRHSIVFSFKDRYPKYLKHYTYRHNEMARRLGVHLINKSKIQFKISYGHNNVLIYSISKKTDTSGLEKLLLRGLKHLLPNDRGSVANQFSKIKQALENSKIGPMRLTKGIEVYMDFNCLLMKKKSSSGPSLPLELNEYKKFTYEQFQNYLVEYIPIPDNNDSFPFIVVVKNPSLKRVNFSVSYNCGAAKQCQDENRTYYPALKLLREWSKNRNRHKMIELAILKFEA